ncbi:hypothetical protein [Rhodanobacter sp. L36]|nr:hypothetical protein [Rhodanobacter sp. L36]
MNSFLKYSLLDKYIPPLLVAFATASIAFGLFWSVHASLLLNG